MDPSHCPVFVEVSWPDKIRRFPCATRAPSSSIKFELNGKQTKISSFLGDSHGREEIADAATMGYQQPSSDRVAPPSTQIISASSHEPKQLKLKHFLQKQCSNLVDETGTDSSRINISQDDNVEGKAIDGMKHDCEEREQKRSRLQSQQEAKEAWKRIQDKMRVPYCKHGLKAVTKKVNKQGPNKGRYFYTCPKPEGNGPQGQCGFFQWVTNRRPNA